MPDRSELVGKLRDYARRASQAYVGLSKHRRETWTAGPIDDAVAVLGSLRDDLLALAAAHERSFYSSDGSWDARSALADCDTAEDEKLRRTITAAVGPRPIDTAPQDGSMILVHGVVNEGLDWHKAHWSGDYDGDERRYWRAPSPGFIGMVRDAKWWAPLPPQPNVSSSEG